MTAIDIPAFAGIAPRHDPHKLPPENGVLASNCRVENGNLSAWYELTPIAAALRAGVVRSIFHYEHSHWFSWLTAVNAIKSPIARDQYRRVFYTGDGVPKVTSNLIATGSDPKPAASYDLGVPAPTGTVIAVVDNTGSDPEEFSDDDSRAYFMTYVTEYGEEGPQTAASNIVVVFEPGNPVTLTLPSPISNTQNITHKRIYRAASTGGGSDSFRVATVPIATTEYIDTVLPTELGSPLETFAFDPPPDDMQGLVLGANGIAAGFVENQVLFSEAYQPAAWPVSYRQATDEDIVAIGPTSTGFVVATKGLPWFFSGVSPDSISGSKMELKQSCVSARSMVDMGNFVIYASPDGLVLASEGGAKLISEPLFTKRTWQAFQPETIHAYVYEDQYVAFYGDVNDDGNGVGGFIYHPTRHVFTPITTYATAGYLDQLTDTLFLVVDDELVTWDSGVQPQQYRWKSRIFRTNPTTFPWYRVFTDNPAKVGIRVYANNKKIWEEMSLQDEIGRLPSIILAEEWQIELFGTADVQAVRLATSAGELA